MEQNRSAENAKYIEYIETRTVNIFPLHLYSFTDCIIYH